MATVFCDAQVIIYFDYLEKAKSLNSYYIIIGAFEEWTRKKTTAHDEIKMIFHQDNRSASNIFSRSSP